MIEAFYYMNWNGKECELKVIGHCSRAFDGKITCEVDKVLTEDGMDVTGYIPEDHMPALRTRLWTVALMHRHPNGEPEAAV